MVHPGQFDGKNLRDPQGALQIPPFGRDDKGRGVAQVGVVSGWAEPQVSPLRYAPVETTKSFSSGPQSLGEERAVDATALSSRPERTRISHFAMLARTTCAALLKESRMEFINATGLNGKSGGAQWRDLRFYPSA
jgi:hypothetical protein